MFVLHPLIEIPMKHKSPRVEYAFNSFSTKLHFLNRVVASSPFMASTAKPGIRGSMLRPERSGLKIFSLIPFLILAL
jgi:hypothetical protein